MIVFLLSIVSVFFFFYIVKKMSTLDLQWLFILLSIKVISLSIRAGSRATCCDYFWRRWCKSEEGCQYFIIWQILWKGPQLHCWYKNNLAFIPKSQLSSPRAESARAVTGRRCPHSGEGEEFLPRQMVPLTKTVVTQKRNAKKSVRRCQNDRNAEGRGPRAFSGSYC